MKKIIITIEDDDTVNDNYVKINEYPKKQKNGWVNGVDICATCPNNPKNNPNAGPCMCTIPAMYGPFRITC